MTGSITTPRNGEAQRSHLLPLAAATLLAAAVFALGMVASPPLTVSDLNHGVTAADLANALTGSGVTISNITYTGNARAAGKFSGGAPIVGFDLGIVLASGKVQTVDGDPACSSGVEGPNDCRELGGGAVGIMNSTNFGLPGDPDLTALSGFPTFDATILQFDFVPQFSTVQFKYVFSSDEYSDFSNTAFNDVFGFFINGVNCALVPGTSEPVGVNTINNGNDVGGDATPHHPELFLDNVNPAPTLDTQMDGLTVTLTCNATVNAGLTNHMKLAIADASDPAYDSAVFLQGGSLISGTTITTSLTGGGQSGPAITVPQGTAVTDSSTLAGANSGSAGGTVTYQVFSDAACQTSFGPGGGTKTVTNGIVPDSDPVPFAQTGVFYWKASYSGDALNNESQSVCGAETVTVTSNGGDLSELSPAHLWIGLRNSDDQGTQFDLQVELLQDGIVVASGLKRCTTGVTRNPTFAKEVEVPFDAFAPVPLDSGDVLSLRVSTRIGTTSTGAKCPGPGGSHNNARGLRLYYDSTGRKSHFDATIPPDPNGNLYLHSTGNPCPGGDGDSPLVTARTLDGIPPTAALAKCKDSTGINFAGGNPFSIIGTWSLAPLP